MLRVVVDPGVLLSALISPNGAPAELVRRWNAGEVQFVCSARLLDEFTTVGHRPKFRQWFSTREVDDIARLLAEAGEWRPDHGHDEPDPADPKDGYLVALAANASADCLTTGDTVLLQHRTRVRIVTAREVVTVLDALDAGSGSEPGD